MLGKVRLGKVYLIHKNKYCHNLVKFSQGPLKFSCAKKTFSQTIDNRNDKMLKIAFQPSLAIFFCFAMTKCHDEVMAFD